MRPPTYVPFALRAAMGQNRSALSGGWAAQALACAPPRSRNTSTHSLRRHSVNGCRHFHAIGAPARRALALSDRRTAGAQHNLLPCAGPSRRSTHSRNLRTKYGYHHPPRAVRDIREKGVPIETFKITSEQTGRKIGAYRFGDPAKSRHGRIGGRKTFLKEFNDVANFTLYRIHLAC